MKAVILLVASASLAVADISILPQCVDSCLQSSLTAVGCPPNKPCPCLPGTHDKLRAQLLPCLEKACSRDDMQKGLDAFNSLCKNLTPSVPAPSSSAAATPTPTGQSNNPAMTNAIVTTSDGGRDSGTKSSIAAPSQIDESGPRKSVSVTTGGERAADTSTVKVGPTTTPATTTTEARNSTVPTTTSPSTSSGGGGGGGGLSKSVVAGLIGLGAGLGGLVLISALAWFFYARGKKAGQQNRDAEMMNAATTIHHNGDTSKRDDDPGPPPKPVEVGGTPVAELP